jgi:hypothetical protein
VEFDEFVQWYTTVGSRKSGVFAHGAPKLGQTILRKDMTNAELRTVFLEIDTDGSGVLDREEVSVLARRLGHDLTEKQLNSAMSEMDTDGDNEVDFEEFKEWCDFMTTFAALCVPLFQFRVTSLSARFDNSVATGGTSLGRSARTCSYSTLMTGSP